MFHPNLIPVDWENMKRLVEEMKEVCRKDPDIVEVPGSPTVKKAFERSAREETNIISDGHLRYIRHPSLWPKVIATVLTLDRYTVPPRWDLSLSIPSMEHGVEPARVSNEYIFSIVQAFLGDGYKEIPPIGAFKAVRQFVKDAPEEMQ